LATEDVTGATVSDEVPAFMNFPGRYIAALPPSMRRASTVLQVCVATFSTLVAVGSSAVPVTRTRPSGST